MNVVDVRRQEGEKRERETSTNGKRGDGDIMFMVTQPWCKILKKAARYIMVSLAVDV